MDSIQLARTGIEKFRAWWYRQFAYPKIVQRRINELLEKVRPTAFREHDDAGVERLAHEDDGLPTGDTHDRHINVREVDTDLRAG
jgi:hypothetical protein